jgi:hypothetical protein
VTILTAQMAMAVALQCLPTPLAPIAIGIAMHESRGDTQAIHHNRNGTTDYGLGQINTANFEWLSKSLNTPVNEQTILDPCLNLQASMRVLFAKYNGDPPDTAKAAYAAAVTAKIAALDTIPPIAASPLAVYARPAHAGRQLVYSQ